VISDTGIGMNAEACARLFSEIQPGDSSFAASLRRHRSRLAICKQLTRTHGRPDGVESTLGKGSRFWFELPLPQAYRGSATRRMRWQRVAWQSAILSVSPRASVEAPGHRTERIGLSVALSTTHSMLLPRSSVPGTAAKLTTSLSWTRICPGSPARDRRTDPRVPHLAGTKLVLLAARRRAQRKIAAVDLSVDLPVKREALLRAAGRPAPADDEQQGPPSDEHAPRAVISLNAIAHRMQDDARCTAAPYPAGRRQLIQSAEYMQALLSKRRTSRDGQ